MIRVPEAHVIEELERAHRERESRRPRAEIRLPVPPPIDRPAREVPSRGATVITWTI